MLEEDIEKIIERLAVLADDKHKYKAKVWTNAKGEASFEVRVLGDSIEEVLAGQNAMTLGVMEKIRNAGIPIAGVTNK